VTAVYAKRRDVKHARRVHIFAAGLTCVVLGGCASQGASPTALLTSPTRNALTTGSLPDLATLGNTPTLTGTVTDVYSRIAAKALTCWFSTDGPLKATHVFSAETPPPSSGGPAEITIFEKDATAGNPRGSRAYRMSMTRESDTATRLTLQAGKLPADLAQAMEKDVLAWGLSKDSCEARIVRPAPPPTAIVKTPQKKKRVSAAQVGHVQATPGQAALATPKPAAQPR
jgi:hypothetical protein